MDEVPWWFSLFMSWLPFLIIIFVCARGARVIAKSLHTKDGASLAQVIQDYGNEMKRSNELRERELNRDKISNS